MENKEQVKPKEVDDTFVFDKKHLDVIQGA